MVLSPLIPPLPPYKVKNHKVNYRKNVNTPPPNRKSEKLGPNIDDVLNLLYFKTHK